MSTITKPDSKALNSNQIAPLALRHSSCQILLCSYFICGEFLKVCPGSAGAAVLPEGIWSPPGYCAHLDQFLGYCLYVSRSLSLPASIVGAPSHTLTTHRIKAKALRNAKLLSYPEGNSQNHCWLFSCTVSLLGQRTGCKEGQ